MPRLLSPAGVTVDVDDDKVELLRFQGFTVPDEPKPVRRGRPPKPKPDE